MKLFEREREQADKNVVDLNEKLVAQQATAGDADREDLQGELDKVTEQLQQAKNAAVELSNLRVALKELEKQREQVAAKILDCSGREKELKAQVGSAQQDLTDVDKRLAELREDFDTVAGFAISELGYIPTTGETLTADGVEIAILAADERKITKLRIRKLEEKQGEE